MAITFNYFDSCHDLYTVTNGGTVWSANLNNTSVFDYFADDCVVDDFILFTGHSYHKPKNIEFVIGTAFAATSVTFVWEYWNGSWTTITVIDGTNGFTTSGTVEFVPPADWANTCSENGGVFRRYFPIRCRISAVDTPTEGGANITTKVKIGNNMIKVYTDPYTMDDLYNASVSEGWDVITKLATLNFNVYKVNCDIEIYSGDFTSQNESVIFEKNIQFQTKYGNVTLGTKLSDYTGKNGSAWYWYFDTYSTIGGPQFGQYSGNIYIYGSLLASVGVDNHLTFKQGTGKVEIVNSILQTPVDLQMYVSTTTPENFVMRNVECVASKLAVSSRPMPGVFEDVTITAIYSPLRMTYSAYGTVLGMASRGSPTVGGVYGWNSTGTMNFHNCPDIDITDNRWVVSGVFNYYDSGGQLNDKYSLDLKIVDVNGDVIDGANVVVKDVNGDAITGSPFTSDGSGDVSCGFVIRRVVSFGGPDGGVTSNISLTTDYDPYTVTISKAGYASKTIKYTMDRKREDVVLLSPEGSTQIYDSTIHDSTIY